MREKFGVSPASIPDFLALVGDTSDGYPGHPRLGRGLHRGRAAPLPAPGGHPGVGRQVGRQRARRRQRWPRRSGSDGTRRFLYRELALLRLDAPIPQRSVDELRWRGVPRAPFEALAERLAAPGLRGRVHHWAD